MPKKIGRPTKLVPVATTTTATTTIPTLPSNDLITSLPEDLRILILSFLPTDLAARASFLSSRWKDLWKFVQLIDFSYKNNNRLSAYVICEAMRTHIAPTCREVKIRVNDSDEEVHHHVASWFYFAARKSVERMKLYLPIADFSVNRDTTLDFPELSFGRTDFLKYLSIHSKNVSSNNIEYILKNCPNLEELSLCGSFRVIGLTISSKSLKKLKISNFEFLEELKINAKNLVSFKYCGQDSKIIYENVPLLGEVSFVDTYYRSERKFEQLLTVIEQIETVKLSISFPWFDKFTPVDKLRKVKNLELKLKVWISREAFNVISTLLEALPGLHKLKIHLFWAVKKYECRNWLRFISESQKKIQLRAMELVGFIGSDLDMATLEYLIKNAGLLETLRVHVCKEESVVHPVDLIKHQEKIEAIEIAYKFGGMLLPSTKFVVV